MDFYNGVDYNEHMAKPLKKLPERGIKLFFYMLATYPTKMLLLNLLFVLFSLPIVTMPAALTAMSRVIMLYMRDGYAHVWQDFIKDFKGTFWKSLLAGLLYMVVMVVLLTSAKIYPMVFTDEIMASFCFSLAVALMIAFSVMMGYVFPMIAMVDLKLSKILKNAAILLYTRLLNSFVMALLIAGFCYLAFYLFPGSLPIALTILVVLYQLAVCVNVKVPFEKYVYKE